MTKLFTVLALSFLAWKSEAGQRVRRIPVQGDQIVTVRTSTGIATIIQVPDRPNSVVVGDQDSFKVEYLDQAITIKPLVHGAKSNLYIYTDWKRFNVELVSGAESIADYVVYLEIPKVKPKVASIPKAESLVRWSEIKNHLRNDNLLLNVKRVGRMKDGTLLVQFKITSTTKEAFKPEWIWTTQGGVAKPIHNLFMSAIEAAPQRAILGVLQLREADLDLKQPIRLELRRNKISYLTINKVNSWKR